MNDLFAKIGKQIDTVPEINNEITMLDHKMLTKYHDFSIIETMNRNVIELERSLE